MLLGHSPYSPEKRGMALRITHSKSIELLSEGKTLETVSIPDLDVNSFFMRLKKEQRKVSVYIAPSFYDKTERNVLSCELPYETGGVVSFFGRNISGSLSGVKMWGYIPQNFDDLSANIARPTYIWLQ